MENCELYAWFAPICQAKYLRKPSCHDRWKFLSKLSNSVRRSVELIPHLESGDSALSASSCMNLFCDSGYQHLARVFVPSMNWQHPPSWPAHLVLVLGASAGALRGERGCRRQGMRGRKPIIPDEATEKSVGSVKGGNEKQRVPQRGQGGSSVPRAPCVLELQRKDP